MKQSHRRGQQPPWVAARLSDTLHKGGDTLPVIVLRVRPQGSGPLNRFHLDRRRNKGWGVGSKFPEWRSKG